jgi:hypothetical protein
MPSSNLIAMTRCMSPCSRALKERFAPGLICEKSQTAAAHQ